MLTPTLRVQYADQGFVVIPGFWDADTCRGLRERAQALARACLPGARPAVFSTVDRARTADAALIASADAVHAFYEEEAFDDAGRLVRAPEQAVNKLGHALHDRDPVFREVSRGPALAALAADLGLQRPQVWQSQVIFKQPGIGGEVRWHQDGSFFVTTPESVTTFWFALEDADRDNGCLWVQPGAHRGPLRERFVREAGPDGDTLRMQALDATPWPAPGEGVPLEVPAGTLVCFHGRLPHGSAANRSARSRLAYTLHATDGRAAYAASNWLRRPEPPGF